MRATLLALVLCGACAAPALERIDAGLAAPRATPTLLPCDPVALLERGETVEGDAATEVVRGNYAYRFVDAAARARFLADPQRYEIALGGGCARMGPLSGAGSVERRLVHDGRIYLAASDGCRKAFLADPQAFLEPAPESVAADPEGTRLARRCAEWLGGARDLDGDVALASRREERQGDTLWIVRQLRVLGRDGRYLDRTAWNESVWWNDARWSSDGAVGFARSVKSPERGLDASQLAALRREALREPLVLAREIVAGRAHAHDSGRAGWQVGEATHVGRAVEIACDGVRVVWLVAEDDGRLLAQRGLKRLGSFRVGDELELLEEWRELSGVRVPLARVRAGSIERWDSATLVELEEQGPGRSR